MESVLKSISESTVVTLKRLLATGRFEVVNGRKNLLFQVALGP